MPDNQLQKLEYDMLISIIVPVHNEEQALPKCMESILRQTYKNLEIVLIDDGSTDGSEKLCDEYCDKDTRCITYHIEHGGLSVARNYGVTKANGEYITFIDSDDYVDEDYVEYLYYLIRDTGLNMAICQHRIKFGNGNVLDYGKKGKELLSSKACIERMLYHDLIDTSVWGKLYERHLFDKVQFPDGMLYEDIGTTYKLFLQCSLIAVGYGSKYTYVRRKNSIVNKAFHCKKLDLIEMTDRMGADVLAHYPELKNAVLRRRFYARISTLNQMLEVSGFEEKREEILRFIREKRNFILRDSKAPKRDKIALLLIGISYRLYRLIWISHQKHLWKNTKAD